MIEHLRSDAYRNSSTKACTAVGHGVTCGQSTKNPALSSNKYGTKVHPKVNILSTRASPASVMLVARYRASISLTRDKEEKVRYEVKRGQTKHFIEGEGRPQPLSIE